MDSIAFGLSRWGYAVLPGYWPKARCDALLIEANCLEYSPELLGTSSSAIATTTTATTTLLEQAARELTTLGLELDSHLGKSSSRSPFRAVRLAHEKSKLRLSRSQSLSVVPPLVSKRTKGASLANNGLVVAVYLNRTDGGEISFQRPGHSHKDAVLTIPPRPGTLVVFCSTVTRYTLQPSTDYCFALSVRYCDHSSSATPLTEPQPQSRFFENAEKTSEEEEEDEKNKISLAATPPVVQCN